eukprot:gene41603-55158_t
MAARPVRASRDRRGLVSLNRSPLARKIILFNLLALLSLPVARQVEQQRFEQAQLEAADQAVALAAETRQAWFSAVAAQQLVTYAGQVQEAADAAGELALRLPGTTPSGQTAEEVRRFGLEGRVAELARRLQLPVLTTFMGRGLLAEEGVPFHGTYLGVAGAPETSALLDDSDLPMMLGAILSDSNFGVSAQRMDFRRALIAAHREARVGHHLYPNIPLAAL